MIHCGGEIGAVLRGGYSVFRAVRGVIGVYEIHVVALVDVLEERAFLSARREVQRVPAYVRYLEISRDHLGYGTDAAGYESQTAVFAVFEALLEEELHAETDAQKGLAGQSLPADHVRETAVPQLSRRVLEGAHARKKDHIGRPDDLRISADPALGADGVQRALERE